MKKFATACAVAALGVMGLAPTAAATTNTSHPQPIFGASYGPDEYGDPIGCPDGTSWRYSSTATGRMSHLGNITVEVTHCTVLSTASFSGGEMTITAASGDQLFLEHSGTFELTLDESGFPVRSDVDLDWVIVGGTGRFQGATGSGEGTGFGLFEGGTTTGTTMNYVGTITTAVGAARSR